MQFFAEFNTLQVHVYFLEGRLKSADNYTVLLASEISSLKKPNYLITNL